MGREVYGSDRAHWGVVIAVGAFDFASRLAAFVELLPGYLAPLADPRHEIEAVPAGPQIGWCHLCCPKCFRRAHFREILRRGSRLDQRATGERRFRSLGTVRLRVQFVKAPPTWLGSGPGVKDRPDVVSVHVASKPNSANT
jgi:hypothetical protein